MYWHDSTGVMRCFIAPPKTGCQIEIEERQLGFVAHLENCLDFVLVVEVAIKTYLIYQPAGRLERHGKYPPGHLWPPPE